MNEEIQDQGQGEGADAQVNYLDFYYLTFIETQNQMQKLAKLQE